MRPYQKKVKRGEAIRWKKANAVPIWASLRGEDSPINSLIKRFGAAKRGLKRDTYRRVIWRIL